ncbi:class I SAM-dependent methyltransferase [Aliidiomarina maris]|uniref:Methyltransferase family protein n=1 Tax=Aliidiomarina maris TaxID=531312 RepID=A0A327X716_9GAMM|nr:methyltransferase domain-containing protein [Aliidiomarina maris]RAK01854.1 methyltransferase family protein [Aliidiomarina maris]RUO28662.1 hypothetical protein CWE07_02390 [Aliidiomarina maris]
MHHWTTYWQSTPSLNSFAEGTSRDGYNGELKAFWDSEFAACNDSACILDLATGNGAIALLAAKYKQTQALQFKIFASDAADIKPLENAGLSMQDKKLLSCVDFFPNTRNEALGFSNASFDLVVSQFGFEYGAPESSIIEIERVLKPGGRAVLLVHHVDSSIVQDSKGGIQVLNMSLHESPVFIQAELCLELLRQASTLNSKALYNLYQASTSTLKWVMQQLKTLNSNALSQAWVDDVLSRVAQVMANPGQASTEAQLQSLRAHYAQLTEHLARISDQINAAYDEKRSQQLRSFAQQSALQIEISPFHLANVGNEPEIRNCENNFAMLIQLRKPALKA